MTPDLGASVLALVVAVASLAVAIALARKGGGVFSLGFRNPLREVPPWVLLGIPCAGLAYLQVPWWVWPLPLLGLYVLHVVLWPLAPCRRCGGEKKRKAAGGGRAFGKCRACGGSGERVRWAMLRDGF